MKTLANYLGLLLVSGVAYMCYAHYQEKERIRLDALRKVEEEEKQKREDAARDREVERQARLHELEQQRLDAQQRRAMEQAAAEEKNRKQEEARLQQEEERKRLAEEEKRLRASEEAASQAEAVRTAEAASERDTEKRVELARRNVNLARIELSELEKQKAEHEKNCTAAKNRASVAKKYMNDSLVRARAWASQAGVKYVDPDNPWYVVRGRSAAGGGVNVVQNNNEQINKEMNEYVKAKTEFNKMGKLLADSEHELRALAPRIEKAKFRLDRAILALRDLGVDPNAPAAKKP